MAVNYRQIKAIEQKNKKRILEVCNVPETPGIYILTREENGFRYAYVGQAKHMLTRLAQHLSGYQHIDLSLKKHGLKSADNLYGWDIQYVSCPIEMLDAYEQEIILIYANQGYQLRNKTSGSQGEGKRGLDDQKSPKGYYDGLAQGYKNAQRFVANLFEKHLVYGKRSEKPNKNQDKALEKFEGFINGTEEK